MVGDSNGGRKLEVAGVFLYLHGGQPVVDFLHGAVELSPQGCIAVNKEHMSTSVPGVYAAGDVTCKKLRQAVIAAAEGCIAALSASGFLQKQGRARSQWSSVGG